MYIFSIDEAIAGHTPSQNDAEELLVFIRGFIESQGKDAIFSCMFTKPTPAEELTTSGITMVVFYSHKEEVYWKDSLSLIQEFARNIFHIPVYVIDLPCLMEVIDISVRPICEQVDAYQALRIQEIVATGMAFLGKMYLNNFVQKTRVPENTLFPSYRAALTRHEGVVQQIVLRKKVKGVHNDSLYKYAWTEIEGTIEMVFEVLDRHFILVDKKMSSLSKAHIATRSVVYPWRSKWLSKNLNTFFELVYGYQAEPLLLKNYEGEQLPIIGRYKEACIRLQDIPPLALSILQELITPMEERDK